MQPKTSTSNPVRIVVALPLRNQEPLKQFLSKLSDPSSGRYHHFLTREQFAASYAPDSADLQKVASQLAQSGLQSKIGNLAVFATGSGQCVGAYFQTPIDEVRYETSIGAVVKPVARGSLHLSPLLRSLSASIIGLERIPPAEPLSLRGPSLDPRLDPQNIHGPYGPYMTDDLKQAYRFPSALDVNGDGVTIATVMAGAVHRADIDYYAHAVLHQSSFRFAMVDIDGGAGFDPNAGSAESTLDLEQAGGIAPRSDIILYNIPNLSPYYNYLAYDAAYSNKRVLVVNSSFGQCEKDFASAQGVSELKSFDDLFAAGSAVGVTWVAASGDQAAYGCPDGVYNKISVEFPASDPYILAVGGTNLTTAHSHGSRNSAYISESAYYEPRGGGAYWGSGGGQSRLFRVPSWQRDFIRPFIRRGVPDLALHMGGLGFSSGGSYCGALKCHIDDSSDWLRLAGRWTQVIGTSAASPDIVGLIALRIEKQRSALGDIHTWLYDEARHARVFRRGIHGFNGYRTSRGLWDPVLGTGTPFGNTFAGTASVAGTPGTPSNP
jgi:subtilase family serine protease